MTATLIAVVLVVGAPEAQRGGAGGTPTSLAAGPQRRSLPVGRTTHPVIKIWRYEFTSDGKWIIYRHGKVMDDKPRSYALEPKVGPTAIEINEWHFPQPSIF